LNFEQLLGSILTSRRLQREYSMKTRLAIKLGAVALALLVNSLILGGTTFVVGSRSQAQPDEPSVACARAKMVHLTV
jgi:hypothetical protein